MENSTSIKPIAYSYGVVLALFSIVMLVILYVLNVEEQNWIVGSINVIVPIIIFVLAIKAFKAQNGGFMTLGQAIKTGLAVAAVAGVISAVYTYVHYSFIYPEFIEMTRDKAIMDMSTQGMTETQINQAMEMSGFFMSPVFFATASLLMTLFFGFIISLIAGAIMKRERPE